MSERVIWGREELEMSEWDFLHGLEGQDLDDAMSSGATAAEWAMIDAQDAEDEEE
ncbi:hypothetical protein ACR5KS_01945 [Leucobacter sp. W1153]|uniref:hypothetical protein n=1 Tax=Leucobacter sp. W1153 TaxID=3439064 RepID=UPI003F2F7D17